MSNTVVLVHGAWHGAWVWHRVLDALAARQVRAVTVELPSCSDGTRGDLAADAATVERAVAAVDGRVTVCGHSYGGMVITQARFDERVTRLVYLCAFMPEPGMSLVAHFPEGPPPYAQIRDDGTVEFVRSMARAVFYHDVDEAEAEASAAKLVLHSAAAITMPVDRASWQERPSTYVVCTEDRTIPVEIQRRFARRASDVVELAASHSPMLSRPDEVAEILIRG